jgi:hypothetical protein
MALRQPPRNKECEHAWLGQLGSHFAQANALSASIASANRVFFCKSTHVRSSARTHNRNGHWNQPRAIEYVTRLYSTPLSYPYWDKSGALAGPRTRCELNQR